MLSIDLNSDIGESFGKYIIGNDEKILDYVTSVNIACGFHAGDPIVMEKTVKQAIEKGVSIGAHPGYPDLIGFGRRQMTMTDEELRAYIIYQVGALKTFVELYGGKLQHVKPHGAMYNSAAKDYHLSSVIAQAIYDVDKELIMMGLTNSCMIDAAKDIGLDYASEVFADRAFNDDGSLVSREKAGAMIEDVDECASRVLRMVKSGEVVSINGKIIPVQAHSICVHGDTLKAVEFVKAIRDSLKNKGIEFDSLSR